MRLGRATLFSFCYLLVTCAGYCAAQEEDADVLLPRAEADLLVEQLGHGEFTRREAATQRLLAIGLTAADALRRGQQHVDREIRFRCTRILTRVRAEQRRRRLEAFLTHEDSDYSHELPCWPRFRRLAGDTARSRALFAEMLRSEWDLLAQWEDPAESSQALIERCIEMEQARSQFRLTPTLASVAALLLLASDEEIRVPDQIGTKLYVLCSQVPSFRRSLEIDGKNTAVIRSLVGAWIERGEGTMTGYYCLNLAMRHHFQEGVDLAERILAQKNVPIHYREYSILTIAKLGDAKHLPILEGLLSDQSVCRTRKDSKTGTTTRTQVRDIALAAIIHLSGNDPKQFGFTQLRTNPLYVFVTTTAGFSSEQQRLESQRKWEEFSRKHEKAG